MRGASCLVLAYGEETSGSLCALFRVSFSFFGSVRSVGVRPRSLRVQQWQARSRRLTAQWMGSARISALRLRGSSATSSASLGRSHDPGPRSRLDPRRAVSRVSETEGSPQIGEAGCTGRGSRVIDAVEPVKWSGRSRPWSHAGSALGVGG